MKAGKCDPFHGEERRCNEENTEPAPRIGVIVPVIEHPPRDRGTDNTPYGGKPHQYSHECAEHTFVIIVRDDTSPKHHETTEAQGKE